MSIGFLVGPNTDSQTGVSIDTRKRKENHMTIEVQVKHNNPDSKDRIVVLTLQRGSPMDPWIITKEQIVNPDEVVTEAVYGLNRIIAVREILNGENLK